MACGATLKRHHEFDPLSPLHNSPGCSPKRICRQLDSLMSPASQSKRLHPTNIAFAEAAQKFMSDHLAARMSPSGSKLLTLDCSKFSPSTSTFFHSALPHLSQSTTINPAVGSHMFPQVAAGLPVVKKEKDVPLFTLKQVNSICKNMVVEHEQKVRQEYDRVLSNKLAEQYESFLKFNHEQLHKRFGNSTASYVS